MDFDYAQYYQGCFLLPTVFLVIALVVLTVAGIDYTKRIVARRITAERSVSLLIAILVFGFLIGLNGSRLLHGGLYLLREKEQDAATCTGVITQIRELNRFEFPELASSSEKSIETTTNGVAFEIDNVAYVAVYKGPFEIGDRVEVTYLPKSHYVLSMTKDE